MKAIEAHCQLCGHKEQIVIAENDRSGQELTTIMCENCGLVRSHPIPEPSELEQFYNQQYRKQYKKTSSPKLKHIYRSARRCLARLQTVKPYLRANDRVLDIGAGGGEFVYLLTSLGINAAGIEPNEGYQRFATDQLGVKVQLNTVQSANVPPASLDLVTAHHVIEHLADPLAVFGLIKSWLKPGGRLIAEVPNINATIHAPIRKFHYAHIYNFSPATFCEMARQAGLNCVSMQSTPKNNHLLAVFENTTPEQSAIDMHKEAVKTKQQLIRHTMLQHHLSVTPYRRFWNNFTRPYLEARACKGFTDPASLLDHYYGKARE